MLTYFLITSAWLLFPYCFLFVFFLFQFNVYNNNLCIYILFSIIITSYRLYTRGNNYDKVRHTEHAPLPKKTCTQLHTWVSYIELRRVKCFNLWFWCIFYGSLHQICFKRLRKRLGENKRFVPYATVDVFHFWTYLSRNAWPLFAWGPFHECNDRCLLCTSTALSPLVSRIQKHRSEKVQIKSHVWPSLTLPRMRFFFTNFFNSLVLIRPCQLLWRVFHDSISFCIYSRVYCTKTLTEYDTIGNLCVFFQKSSKVVADAHSVPHYNHTN